MVIGGSPVRAIMYPPPLPVYRVCLSMEALRAFAALPQLKGYRSCMIPRMNLSWFTPPSWLLNPIESQNVTSLKGGLPLENGWSPEGNNPGFTRLE